MATKSAPATKSTSAHQSKFATFLTDNKLDPRRVLIASKHLEAFTAEDRGIKLAKRQSKKEGAVKKEAASLKPRTGRPITPRAIEAALKGASLTGPQKTRLLKAVNLLLDQKKKAAVQLKVLF
jgi:hypothetical protein